MKAFIGFITIFIFGLSATVNSQTDSCSSTLNLQNVNLPFDAASLNCLAVWDAHNYILRVSQPHLFHHSFIHTYLKTREDSLCWRFVHVKKISLTHHFIELRSTEIFSICLSVFKTKRTSHLKTLYIYFSFIGTLITLSSQVRFSQPVRFFMNMPSKSSLHYDINLNHIQ